jgi:hypothetical protein
MPTSELHPGPPLSHIVKSSVAEGVVVGKYQKYSQLSFFAVIGRIPAYDSPISKSTSGSCVPWTMNAIEVLACEGPMYLGQ